MKKYKNNMEQQIIVSTKIKALEKELRDLRVIGSEIRSQIEREIVVTCKVDACSFCEYTDHIEITIPKGHASNLQRKEFRFRYPEDTYTIWAAERSVTDKDVNFILDAQDKIKGVLKKYKII